MSDLNVIQTLKNRNFMRNLVFGFTAYFRGGGGWHLRLLHGGGLYDSE